jgi:glycerate 2-kinase
MNILIAPNAFKNSLAASASAEAIRQGLIQSGLTCTIRCFPIGDGGDGTAALIVDHLNGYVQDVDTVDPLGRKITTSIGFVDNGRTAVIEMADSSGLKLLQANELDPMRASSYGTGNLMHIALNRGVRRIILCIGGSATVDGGCGILQALGANFQDRAKMDLKGLPANLVQLDWIDSSGIDKRIWETELIILCDVNNYLLGPHGAASVFGPQKGASAADVLLLDQALAKLREVAKRQIGKDMNTLLHGGAAGGVAAGLHVFLNARLEQGISYFLDITGFDEALHNADLLITGEGSIDLQTLDGKGPFGVAKRAKKMGKPVIGLAGVVPLQPVPSLNQYFDVLMAIGHQPENMQSAMDHTAVNLQNTAREMGKLILMAKGF